MKNKKNMMLFILCASMFILTKANATIYKCVNAKSDVYYNDKPCPENDIESQLKSVKDPTGGYIPSDVFDQQDTKLFAKSKDGNHSEDLNDRVKTQFKDESVTIQNSLSSATKDESMVNVDVKDSSKNKKDLNKKTTKKTVFNDKTTNLIFE